jgi:SNF2 family DNA or RNA helicase
MYEINPSEWKTKPFDHQIKGVKFLISRPYAALFDEMGSGKSKQFVDTACTLWRHGAIDTVMVVAPSAVKTTWSARESGQIDQHTWVPSYVEEHEASNLRLSPLNKEGLQWIVVSYEFIRNEARLNNLFPQLYGRKVMVVFDESSFIKSHRAAQTKAAKRLRSLCARAYLANGSPINNNIIDLYAPFSILDKNVIGCQNWWQFRNRYCTMGGFQGRQIVGYRDIPQLQQRLAPFILRRLKEDCLDLPPKIYSVQEIPLSEKTWAAYKEFSKEMLTWLDSRTPMLTMNAMVKIIRLSQLTSGIAGGLNRSYELMKAMGLTEESVFTFDEQHEDALDSEIDHPDVKIISEEKHAWITNWLCDRVDDDPSFRVIFWCRFRKEQEVLKSLIESSIPHCNVLRIYGGMKRIVREDTVHQFNSTANSSPTVLLAQPRAGGLGLNLQANCAWAVYISNDYSLLTRQQSEDRIHRAGQKASVVNYLDLIATGPQGQKTIDHAVRKALMQKDEFAVKTTAYWRDVLRPELVF